LAWEGSDRTVAQSGPQSALAGQFVPVFVTHSQK
jgi:hypothetical protein